MNIAIYFSATGIILNTIGVVLIFVYGISPFLNKHSDGILMAHSIPTLENRESPENKERRKYRFLSRLGLAFCCIGGIFQLVALLFPWIIRIFHV
jgi:hypothetical protein